MMYWYGIGMGGWGYALMTVSMILFWGAVIFGIVMLVRYLGRSGQPPETPPPASQPVLGGGRHGARPRQDRGAGVGGMWIQAGEM